MLDMNGQKKLVDLHPQAIPILLLQLFLLFVTKFKPMPDERLWLRSGFTLCSLCSK